MTALEIIKHYYDCFNRKNWEGMAALVAPDLRHEVNQGEVRIGVEKYREFLQLMDECYEETLTDLVYMSDATTERFACEFTVHGIYKKGDEPPARHQSYVLPAGAFLEVKNGKITRITTYYNLPLWIKLVSQ